MSLKSIYLMLFVCLLGLTTGYAQTNLGEGLVGYWPLDEGAGTATADVTGNGSDGTLTGDPTWVEGKLGGA